MTQLYHAAIKMSKLTGAGYVDLIKPETIVRVGSNYIEPLVMLHGKLFDQWHIVTNADFSEPSYPSYFFFDTDPKPLNEAHKTAVETMNYIKENFVFDKESKNYKVKPAPEGSLSVVTV